MVTLRTRRIFTLIYIAAFLLATFFDLEISLFATAHVPAFLVHFGARFGAAVAAFAASYALHGMHEVYTLKWQVILFRILGLIASGVASYMLCRPSISPGMLLLFAVTAVVIDVIMIKAVSLTEGDTEVRKKIFWAIIAFVAVSQIGVNILKVIFARPRFLYMEDPLTEFVPWYVVSGPALVDDTMKSFPSGHTTSACAVMCIMFFPQLYPKLRGKDNQMFALSVLLIIVIAASRIFAGMHFLSDTLAAMGICVLEYMMIRKLIHI